MRVLLDTDVLIDVEKGVRELPEAENHISVITLYEFVRGRKDFEKAKRLLEEAFTVIPLTNEVLLKATEIWRILRLRGSPIDDRDLLIAATAIAHRLKLCTKNRKHFEKIVEYGLELISPE